MATYSKFLALLTGADRQVDLSNAANTLAVANLGLLGSTSGTLTHLAAATTTSYSLTWPGSSTNGVLTNTGGVLSWAAASGGTVTAVSVASANGFAGTSSGGATPALTLSTTVTGILYGNGTSVAAAVAGNFPTLNQSTTGTAANITATSNSTLTTLSALSLPFSQLSGQATLSQLPSIANNTILGNNSGSTGVPSALTASQVNTLLGLSSTYLALAGGTMTGAINLGGFAPTNSTTPVNPNDLANKAYVDSVGTNTSWKTAVLLATTANLTALSGEQTIDGVLTSSSRVLVKNQTSAAANGIYTTGTGAWVRTSDMNTWAQVPAAAVFVQEGTVNADLGWVCTSAPGGTLGTTAINFVQFSSAGSYSADGVTLQLVSGVFSIKAGGVGTTQLGTITDGITLDQSGSLSTLEIKNNGVSYAKIQTIAANSLIGNPTGSVVNASAISLGATLAFSGSALQTAAGTGDVTWSANSFATTIAASAVTASKLAASAFDQVTLAGGGGTTASVIQAPALRVSLVAGQTFASNTTVAVRWGITANGETANHIYAADMSTTSYDLFYIIGTISPTSTITAGNSVIVTRIGFQSLGTADVAFGTGTEGKAVFLTSAGAYSLTPPSSAGQAVARIGIVMVGSATATSCFLDVQPAAVGVN